jgi:hypothetical protein
MAERIPESKMPSSTCAPARTMAICLSSNRERVAIALLVQASASRPVLADTGNLRRLEGSRQRQLVRARIHR